MEYLSDDNAAIYRRMRAVRHTAHLTQEKLADDLDVSVNYLGEVERGRKPLSLSLADQFCTYFNVTYDYLFHGTLPIYRPVIRESSVYQSTQTSLYKQLNDCSLQEIVVISQLVDSYLSSSRQFQSQEFPQDKGSSKDHADPEEDSPKFS